MKPEKEDPILPTTAIVDPSQRAKIEDQGQEVVMGQWYWVDEPEKKTPWFACVTRIGSNYIKLEDAKGASWRIHTDTFDDMAKREPDPDRVIGGKVEECKTAVAALMGEIKAVTASLAIAPSPVLGDGGAALETQALALRSGDQDMKSYGTALERAKSETLPALFEKIRKKNEEMSVWMTAQILPMKAQANALTGLIGKIQDRIFSVSLYAGLSEDVEKIKDGAPAALTTKVHLFQRRLYMDEECLANYEAGGMEFRDLAKFEAWLLRSDNLARTFPFPRCVVAFRVRHFDKERAVLNPIDMFRNIAQRNADLLTFLYIRNGEQVFRMATDIEFGENLFPDIERSGLHGKLWGTPNDHPVIITDNDRRERLEQYRRDLKEYKIKRAAYEAALQTPEALAKAKERGLKTPNSDCVDVPYVWRGPSEPGEMVPFDRDTVYFDDMKAKIESTMKEHNRIALVLQGLLDRSPVFHPHPPWQIWTQEGFESAFELIHDDTRGLSPGDKPDFEAYRARLNKSLKTGSITVGQQDEWMRAEAAKEAERRRSDHRHRGEYFDREFYQPYGNPGPGILARTENVSRTGRCTWSWHKTGSVARTAFSCPAKEVLNVDAYKPGDFKQFFADPRTRAEYLEWAPLLLAAEDHHAGKGKPVHAPVMASAKKPSTWEGQERYRRQKETKALIGKAVSLVRHVETQGGKKYPIGSFWRVTSGANLLFEVERIFEDDGMPTFLEYQQRERIRNISRAALWEEGGIPAPSDDEIMAAIDAARAAKKAAPDGPSPAPTPETDADTDGALPDGDPGFADDAPEDDDDPDDT